MGLFGKSDKVLAQELIEMKQRITSFPPFLDAVNSNKSTHDYFKSIEIRLHCIFVQWVICIANMSSVKFDKRKSILDSLVSSLYSNGDEFVNLGSMIINPIETQIILNGLQPRPSSIGPETIMKVDVWTEGFFYGTLDENNKIFEILYNSRNNPKIFELNNPLWHMISMLNILMPLNISDPSISPILAATIRNIIKTGLGKCSEVFR